MPHSTRQPIAKGGFEARVVPFRLRTRNNEQRVPLVVVSPGIHSGFELHFHVKLKVTDVSYATLSIFEVVALFARGSVAVVPNLQTGVGFPLSDSDVDGLRPWQLDQELSLDPRLGWSWLFPRRKSVG